MEDYIAARGLPFKEELEKVLDFYGSDFDPDLLETQLISFSALFSDSKNITFTEILKVMKGLTTGHKALYSQVIILVKLILVMPATNAVSERSFSALRRIKTFLWATMHQQRLNSIMILNVHQDKTDSLNVMSIANQFVAKNERRLAIFGKFPI